jgi:hypothetical protein
LLLIYKNLGPFLYDNSYIQNENKKNIWIKIMENLTDKFCALKYVTLQQIKKIIDKRRAIDNQIDVLSTKLKKGIYLLQSFRNISK